MAQNLSVLVIEDNDFVRMQIVGFLRGGGHTCIEAKNAQEAMEVVKGNEQTIGCMLVDVRMEPEDGFDFLNKISALDVKIPAILVTGDDNPDVLTKASGFGVLSVLMKPVNKDRLLQMVDRAMAGSGHV